MRLKAAVLGVSLLVLGAGVANAGQNWIGVNGGAGIPTGDYGDAASTGWHFGATGTHSINDTWGLGADLAYHKWSASDEMDALLAPGEELSFTAFQSTAHAVMNVNTQGHMKPYLKGGLGLYSVTSKLESPSGDSDVSKSKLGFNFGGGMNFPSQSNMRFGVDAEYHIIPAKDEFGSDLNFVTLGINVMWGSR